MAAQDNSFLGRLDPNLNAQLANAEQQLALAQALQAKAYGGVTPVQANAPIGLGSIIGNALLAYKTPQRMQEANAQIGDIQSKIGQQRLNLMAQMLGGGGEQQTGSPMLAQGGAAPAQGDANSMAATGGGGQQRPPPGIGQMVPDVRQDPVWRNYAMGEQLGLLPQGTADKYAAARYKAAEPTDQMKNDIFSGVSPAARNAITTSASLSPNQSNIRYDAQGNPQLAMVGADPSNNLQYGVQNGVVGAAPVGGVAGARAQLAGAENAARSGTNITQVTGPNGEQVPVWAGPAATAGTQQLGLNPGEVPPYTGGQLPQARLQQIQQAANAGNQQAQMLLQSYNSARPQLGQTQTNKLMTDQGNQLYTQINSENTNNAQHRQILNEMWHLAQAGQFGPGSGGIARLKALASNAGIDMTGAQSDQDVMKKLSANMVMSQLGKGGTGTDAQQANIQAAFPNGEMTNAGMQKVIPMLVSQIDAREARGKAANNFLQNGGQLSDLQGFLSKFNNAADPGTVSLGRRLAEASQNGNVQQVVQQIKQQNPSSWQKILNNVQKLDQMGAF